MSKRALWLAFAAVSVGFVVVSCTSFDGNGNFDPTSGEGGEGGDGSGATSAKAGSKNSGGTDAQAGADSGNGGNGAAEGGSASSGAGAPGGGGDVTGGGVPSEAGMGPGAAGGEGGAGVVTTCESFKECAEGEIRLKEGCAKQKLGVCGKPKAGPVCGCDGITYYDGALAVAGETEVRARGVCGDGAVACEKECKEGYTCGRVQVRGGDCEAKAPGVCWLLPKECPEEASIYGFCANDKCLGLCEAVQSGEQAVVDTLGCAPLILQ